RRLARSSRAAYVSRRAPHTSASWSGTASTTPSQRSARLNSMSEEVRAAVDRDRGADDEAGRLRAEEHDDGSDLLRQPDPTDVVLGAVVAGDGLVRGLERALGEPGGIGVLEVRRQRRRHHGAWADRVYADALGRERPGQVLRRARHGGLGRGEADEPGALVTDRGRGDV